MIISENLISTFYFYCNEHAKGASEQGSKAQETWSKSLEAWSVLGQAAQETRGLALVWMLHPHGLLVLYFGKDMTGPKAQLDQYWGKMARIWWKNRKVSWNHIIWIFHPPNLVHHQVNCHYGSDSSMYCRLGSAPTATKLGQKPEHSVKLTDYKYPKKNWVECTQKL